MGMLCVGMSGTEQGRTWKDGVHVHDDGRAVEN